MSGSLMKYFSDRGGQDSDHRGPLHWPGTAAGVPLRGDAPLLRGDEYDDQIKHTADFHSKLFKLWDAQDKREFELVQDRICNGWYVEKKRYDRWCEEHTGYLVWLEWLQVYGEATNGRSIVPIS